MPCTKATSACVKSCAGAEAACAGTRALIRPAATAASANCGAAEIRLESDIVAMGCADGLASTAELPRTVRTILAGRCASESSHAFAAPWTRRTVWRASAPSPARLASMTRLQSTKASVDKGFSRLAHHAGVHASVPQRGHTCIMDRLRFEPGGGLLRQRL